MYLNLVPAQQRQPAHKLHMPGWVKAGECSKKWPKSGLLWPRPNPNPSHYPNPILQKAFTDPKWSSTPYQHHREPLAIERLIWSCIASRYHYIARIASSTNLSPLSDFWYLSPIKSGLVRAMKLKKNRTNLIVLPLKFIFFVKRHLHFQLTNMWTLSCCEICKIMPGQAPQRVSGLDIWLSLWVIYPFTSRNILYYIMYILHN